MTKTTHHQIRSLKATLIIIGSFFVFGCTMNLSQKSELLTLSHTDEAIVEYADNTTDTIYDPLLLLKRGEAFRVKEDYPRAATEYARFLELHPTHRMASFAQYFLAESYAQQVDTTDRDPESARHALYAFHQVVTKYPDSVYAKDAEKKIAGLMVHEMEYQFRIGYFYYKKKAYPAAIARFENLIREAAHGEITEKTLYYLSLSHHQSGNREQAKAILLQLQTEYKNSLYLQKVLF
ncbi:MAG: outer membrane protein assembly factor BamD [Nitrospirota bacterium]